MIKKRRKKTHMLKNLEINFLVIFKKTKTITYLLSNIKNNIKVK